MKIDELDISILRELRENCKRSASMLAEILDTNPNRIIERIRRLEREGIIRGYHANCDYSKLGYTMHAFISLHLKENAIINKTTLMYIKELPEVTSFYSVTGAYDCFVIARTTTRSALADILKKINNSEYGGKTKTDMIFETYRYTYEFNPFRTDAYHGQTKVEHVERPKLSYDNLDLAIARELKKNAKISYKELGKKLRTHQNTLIHRIRRLEESGIITKYTADIDYAKLGYTIGAVTMLRFKSCEIPSQEVVNEIAAIPEVKALYGISGVYDCAVVLLAKTIDDLARTLRIIRERTNDIARSTTSIILNTYKEPYEYNPFLNMPLLKHEM
jgi:DNA-binding Lrp family transcriptional regulator